MEFLALVAVLGFSIVPALGAQCRCTPIDSCWKSLDWNALNATVSGKLIHNTPPALPCYPGPQHNEQECAYVDSQWSNTTFQADEPIGYSNPLVNNCPAVNQTAGEVPWRKCGLGPSPVYTINASEPEELVAGIAFARENNVRLVVRNTGHDLLGKSTGYGSLQIWMRYLRKGITYQEGFKPSISCSQCDWAGAALTVAGGYVWEDVYQEAFARNLIVVGGGDPTVSVIGGYIQGGGHSPAARDFGLASDQILEAQVILADGTMVIANPCSHSDLFIALRGGGGGTYGVVASVTIKAFPSKPVVAHSLVITPRSPNELNSFLDAIADLYSAFPAISDAGFSGYGSWSVNDPTGTYANSSAGYQHALAVLDKSLPAAKAAFKPVLDRLASYDSINASIEWFEFPSYSAYYRALSGVRQPTGAPESALASRMFDKNSLTSNHDGLREVIGTLAGHPKENTINQVLLVGGGKVLVEPEYSGANPAWRKTYLVHIVARGWQETAGPLVGEAVKADITYNKYQAMRELTPSMGSYLNEADRNNPWWEQDFYGNNYDRLLDIKNKYDPEGIFYCPTCVGSSSWFQQALPGKDYGPICTDR